MFLVAGLAVAGLVGIAAAFYFSIRSGNRGDKRLRSAGAGRAGSARRPGGRNSTARPDLTRPDLTRPDLNGHPRRTSNGTGPITTFRPAAVSPRTTRAKADTGPDPVADFDQVLAGGRQGATATRGGSQWPGDAEAEGSWSEDSWPDDPMPSNPAGDTARTAKPRRRVGFRKGADLDEELWPTELFGGVSDEQFWDDLASDKPLATTARTAQQDPPGRNRLSGPAAGAGLPGRTRRWARHGSGHRSAGRPGPGGRRKRDDRAPGGGRRGPGTGAHPAPRAGTDPAAERTAIQPAYAATQPVQSMKPPLPGATRPVRAAASASQPMSTTSQPGRPPEPDERCQAGRSAPAGGHGRREREASRERPPRRRAGSPPSRPKHADGDRAPRRTR